MKYHFKCKKCDYEFVVDATIGGVSASEIECPMCRGKVRRIWFPTVVHYKGDGFTKKAGQK